MRTTRTRQAIASSTLVGFLSALTAGANANDAPAPNVAAPSALPNEGLRARLRYDAGTQAFAQGHFMEAALDFEAAAAEKANAIALYTAALSWERANVPDRAADDYARALGIEGLATDAAAEAKQRLATLEANLGVVIVSGRPEWRAELDSNTEVPLPARFHGAVGIHTLTVRASGRANAHVVLVLNSGFTARVQLPEPEPGGEKAPAEPVGRRDADARRTVGFVALGASAAVVLSAVLLGVEALDARDAYAAGPTEASYDHAVGLQRWTDAAWITGGVLAAGGLMLVLWPSPHAPPNARTRGAPLRLGVGFANVFVTGGF